MRYLVFLVLYFLTLKLSAQAVFFNHIAQDDGLRNGNVRAILKDHQGFIWIGTEDGLHRYDGYSMKVYRNIKLDSTSLGSNFVLSLFEDSHHNLWVGTLDGGLYVYNRTRDSFRHVHVPTRSHSTTRVAIRSIIQGENDFLYVGSDNLTRASIGDPDSMRFEKVSLPIDTMEDPGIRISALVENFDGTLLVSINTQGLYYYDVMHGIFYPHEIGSIEKNIQAVYVDRLRKLIWIGSWVNGLLVYDLATKKSRRIISGHDSKSLRSNFVASITGDASGNIWIATDNGLSVVDKDVNPFDDLLVTTYLPDNLNQTGLHGSVIKSVYVDNTDKLWVGTYYEGLNVYDKHSMNFGALRMLATDDGSGFGNVNALQEDSDGNLWIGLDGGGLYRQSALRNAERVATPPDVDKIKSMKLDANGNLWLGTWGKGLWRMNTKSRSCKRITTVPASSADIGSEIIALDADPSGNIWVGTFDRGLFQYVPATGIVRHMRGSVPNTNLIDRVNALCRDSLGNLWIGKDVGGLNVLMNGESTYRSIPLEFIDASTTVSTLYCDRKNVLWIGVPNLGLVKYNVVSLHATVYGEENGLANNSIYAIRSDSLGRVWVSHNAGISMLDEKERRFINFTKANGLTASQFNKNCAVIRLNGDFVFGNISGLNFFNPADYHETRDASPVVFTRLLINNIEPVAGGNVLPENITMIRELRLRYDQNSLALEFAALNYDFSQDTEYIYRLAGFNDEWQHTTKQRLISYTNLHPGAYLFEVKARSGTSANTSGQVQVLKIVIVPAWWQTTFFKLSLVVLAVAMMLVFHRLRIRFFIRQQKQLEDQVDKRTKKLNETNELLQLRINDINSINMLLQDSQHEILEKNNEIQAQNEELTAQNEQIVEQQNRLIQAREQLEEINSYLEKTVDERTETLHRTIGDLNKTVFELDRFVYSASHDLSAPLKSIRGLVELIYLEKDPTKIYGYIDYIKMSVMKQETVIKSMVDYARNTHVLVKAEKFLLKKLIEEVIAELAFWSEASRIDYINNVPEDTMLQTDKSRLKVVLHNLISNGIKYADASKSSSWIRFDCIKEARFWKLTIRDNGIGIREEYLDKIFNMYFRATELSKGSGLGLFIVKETLRKINGEIHVGSEHGAYTSFEITLPDIASRTPEERR